MAKARSQTIERPQAGAKLDDSSEHPALTPLMRRLARQYWEVVKAKAEAQGIPIVAAWLSPRWDLEDGPVVFLDVHMDCSRERADAFHHSLNPDRERWEAQLNADELEAATWIPLGLEGVAKSSANGA